MSFKQEVNRILRQLGENLDCGPLEPDDSGRAMLSLDDDKFGVVFYAEEDDDNNAAIIINTEFVHARQF